MTDRLPICWMENESAFPVNAHYHIGSYNEHLHSHWEISINIRNSSTHKIANNTYHLSKYQAILVKPLDKHSIIDNSPQKHTSLNIEISKDFLANFCNQIDSSLYQELLNRENIVTILDKPLVNKIIDFLATVNIYNSRMSDTHNQGAIRNLALLLLSNLLFSHLDNFNIFNSETLYSNPIISKFFKAIQSKENMGLSFKEICEMLNYSEGHIIRIFNQNKLDTPNKIFIRYKLHHACKLLDTTQLSLSDICEQIGFASYSYFTKLFKKEFKMSPIEFRKRNICQ